MDVVVDDLHYLELMELAALIKVRKISPLEVARAQLDRIAALEGELGSYVHVMADAAMAQAETAQAEIAAGKYRGPLHGVPIALKDLFWTKDFPTAAGTAVHRNFRPDQDASVVLRLNQAGAVVLGKLQLTEGAYSDHHPSVTPPKNPWNADYWPGIFVQRPGRRYCGGALLRLARLRYRRFDPLAMRRQWPNRVEAKLGTRQPLRRVRTGSDTGPCRDNYPQRGGCWRDAGRHRRT